MTSYTDLDKLLGRWKYHGAENFENYMKHVGIGLITRKFVSLQKPSIVLTRDGHRIKMVTETALKDFVLEFELCKEFDETTGDGRKMKSMFFMEDGKLIHEQKKVDPNDKDSRIESYVDEDGLLVVTMNSEGVFTKRTYCQ